MCGFSPITQYDELTDGHGHFDLMEVVECLVCVHELTHHKFSGF